MDTMVIILLSLSSLSGFAHIFFEYKKHYPAIYIFKPLTVLIIIFTVFSVFSDGDPNAYQQLIIAGLICSMFGDIFLMLRKQQFIAGLLSFLVAHIIYCVAFYQQLTTPLPWLSLIPLVLPAIIFYGYLYNGLAELKLPVLVYVSAIVIMAFLSLAVYLASGSSAALAAFIGAVVFMISDATLAFDKFKLSFHHAQRVILLTYYTAQWLIAWSTLS